MKNTALLIAASMLMAACSNDASVASANLSQAANDPQWAAG